MASRCFAALLLCVTLVTTAAPAPDQYSVLDFGAKGDGKTDDTATFQKALDTASSAGGGVVYAPRGNYFFAGHLSVPEAVTLKGVWESVPSHVGIRNRGAAKPTDDGTTFLVTESRGKEDGPPFITLNSNSTLKGVVIYYPEQDPAEEPSPYPWAIAMRGKNPAVLAVELLNPYNGIDATPERTAPDSRRPRPAAAARRVGGRDHGHRAHRERAFQPLVEHEAALVPVAAAARRGVHLRPQRLAIRL